MKERLQKYLARAGVASRRHAEALITAGRVSVNNQRVTELGTKVEPGRDIVTLDGNLVSPEEARAYFLLYKPPGVITSLSDPQGRPTVKGLIPPGIRTRLFPVGRLDYDAEGALLLTDDGELANRLMHPRFNVKRTYLAKVRGEPDDATLEKLRGGVRLEDGFAKPDRVERFEAAEKNTWLKLVVSEGRPHLIKRLCAAVGHPVVRLFRPYQAGISVRGMQPGAVRPLTPEEVRGVQAVAQGQTPPEPPLHLPARRHGHGFGEDEGAPRMGSLKPPSEPRRGGFKKERPGGPSGPGPRRGLQKDSRSGPAPSGPGLRRGLRKDSRSDRGKPRR